MSHTSLIVVDLQRDFFDSLSTLPGSLVKAICLPGVRALLNHARDAGWTIVHAVTIHNGSQTLPDHLQRLQVNAYCVQQSEGAEVVQGLQRDNDLVIEKTSFSGFLDTRLDELIIASNKVVIAGVAADCCILHTATDAAERFHKEVYLPFQAVSASGLREYVFGLRAAGKSVAAILDLNDLVGAAHPDWEMKLDPSTITEKLEAWFEPRIRIAERLANLQKINAGASSMALDEQLRALEDELQTTGVS